MSDEQDIADAIIRVRDAGREVGAAEERARIVAWLRAFASVYGVNVAPGMYANHALSRAADCIERGEHHEEA